jgi:phage baseplate assembly protein V
MSAFDELGRLILALEKRIEQLDRRLNNTVREAKVVEVDASKGIAKVEAHGLKSGWSPWLARAGDIIEWEPPTVGERVLFISPTGEPGQGLILQGGYSNQFPQPSTDKGERLVKLGDNIISMTKDRTIAGFKNGGRMIAKKNLVKLKVKNTTHVVLTENGIIVSHAPELGPDPDSD